MLCVLTCMCAGARFDYLLHDVHAHLVYWGRRVSVLLRGYAYTTCTCTYMYI